MKRSGTATGEVEEIEEIDEKDLIFIDLYQIFRSQNMEVYDVRTGRSITAGD